jgi:uncharacterized protein
MNAKSMNKLITFRLSIFAIFASLFLFGGDPVQAVQPQAPGKIADEQLFSYIGKDPLPAGTIPWQLLRQVKLVEGKAKIVKGEAAPKSPPMLPEFSAQLKELDNQEVKIYGFVLPLSTGVKQKHFLISPLPSHCPYCVSQGPDSMVEVVAKTPVEFNQWEPIVVSGKLELVNDQYLFFRLTNAESIKF